MRFNFNDIFLIGFDLLTSKVLASNDPDASAIEKIVMNHKPRWSILYSGVKISGMIKKKDQHAEKKDPGESQDLVIKRVNPAESTIVMIGKISIQLY